MTKYAMRLQQKNMGLILRDGKGRKIVGDCHGGVGQSEQANQDDQSDIRAQN
jgi:hypothetical protein